MFSNLNFKKLLVNNIPNISVSLPTETRGLVPFAEGVTVVLILIFQKFNNWSKWIHITTTRQTYHISGGIIDNEAMVSVH